MEKQFTPLTSPEVEKGKELLKQLEGLTYGTAKNVLEIALRQLKSKITSETVRFSD